MSLFTSAPVPGAGAARRRPVPVPVAAAAVAAAPAPAASEVGHVLFEVGGTTFAVPIGDVREIARSPRLTRLPVLDGSLGRALALVDVRGRSVPVVDLRAADAQDGDVLLPLWRRHAGLVVDRVIAVTAPGELVAEPPSPSGVLPPYARGVVRPIAGGDAVVVVAMPDAVAPGAAPVEAPHPS